jgi:hypothetical protein
VQISRECTPSYLSTGIPNLLQPAQAEVVLGQCSTYLASWVWLTLGARELVAPISPPTQRSLITFTSLGSNLGGMVVVVTSARANDDNGTDIDVYMCRSPNIARSELELTPCEVLNFVL